MYNISIQNLNKNIWNFVDLKKVLKTNNYEKKTVSFNLCSEDSNEFISSFYWNEDYYISVIDILKITKFQLKLLGYKIIKQKKFEGYIFSILRSIKNFKCETSNSKLLNLMYIGNCIRTQKKQKIFYWNNFPHEEIFYEFLDKGMSTVEKTEIPVQKPKQVIDSSNILIILEKNISIFPKPLIKSDLDLSTDFFYTEFTLPPLKNFHIQTYLKPKQQLNKSAVRNFKCVICNKCFKRKEHLFRHKDTHFSLKKYNCNVCDKKFSRNDNLKSHVKLVHN
jgi:uncharacterized Zn-finger protein